MKIPILVKLHTAVMAVITDTTTVITDTTTVIMMDIIAGGTDMEDIGEIMDGMVVVEINGVGDTDGAGVMVGVVQAGVLVMALMHQRKSSMLTRLRYMTMRRCPPL